MTLSDLAALGGFVSGLAVLASLAFLYFQMRQVAAQLAQTEKNQRAMITESYVTRAADTLRWLARLENRALTTRMRTGETALTAEEINQFFYIFRLAILNTQAAFQQNAAGLIDNHSYDAAMLTFKVEYLPHPVYRALWARSKRALSPEFRAVVEAMMRETPLATPTDYAAQFREDLAKVNAEMTGEQG